MFRYLLILVLFIVGGVGYAMLHFQKGEPAALPIALQKHTTDYQDWEEYAPATGQFKVLMPSHPQYISDQTKDKKTNERRKYNTYISEKKNGTVFIINFITYPDQNTLAEDAANRLMNEMLASNEKNKLIAVDTVPYKFGKALDFMIENPEVVYDVRAFKNGKSLIVLSAMSKKELHLPDDFLFFINSFELLNSSGNRTQQ